MGQMSREFLEEREKNLFGIQADYMMLMEHIMENEGEMTEELQDALAINEKDLQKKSDGYVAVINKLDAETAFIDSEVKRLQAQKKVRENAKERLKNALSDAMHTYGLEEIKTHLNKINFRKSEAVVISVTPEELPKKLQVWKCESISKVEIKKMLKSGEEFAGVELVQNKSLQIK